MSIIIIENLQNVGHVIPKPSEPNGPPAHLLILHLPGPGPAGHPHPPAIPALEHVQHKEPPQRAQHTPPIILLLLPPVHNNPGPLINKLESIRLMGMGILVCVHRHDEEMCVYY